MNTESFANIFDNKTPVYHSVSISKPSTYDCIGDAFTASLPALAFLIPLIFKKQMNEEKTEFLYKYVSFIVLIFIQIIWLSWRFAIGHMYKIGVIKVIIPMYVISLLCILIIGGYNIPE